MFNYTHWENICIYSDFTWHYIHAVFLDSFKIYVPHSPKWMVFYIKTVCKGSSHHIMLGQQNIQKNQYYI